MHVIHYSQEHQDKGSEEARNSPENGRRLVDIQEGTDLQEDRCQGLHKYVISIVSGKKISETTCYKKGVFMDGHQQNKTVTNIKVGNRKDLNCLQILIHHHNVQSLKKSIIGIKCLITVRPQKCCYTSSTFIRRYTEH
jgi:hypothetical protein